MEATEIYRSDEQSDDMSPKGDESKNAAGTGAIEIMDVEEGEPKSYYSKLSVILMVAFSGLAIGSDG